MLAKSLLLAFVLVYYVDAKKYVARFGNSKSLLNFESYFRTTTKTVVDEEVESSFHLDDSNKILSQYTKMTMETAILHVRRLRKALNVNLNSALADVQRNRDTWRQRGDTSSIYFSSHSDSSTLLQFRTLHARFL